MDIAKYFWQKNYFVVIEWKSLIFWVLYCRAGRYTGISITSRCLQHAIITNKQFHTIAIIVITNNCWLLHNLWSEHVLLVVKMAESSCDSLVHRMHKAEQDGCPVLDCILYVQKLHVTYRWWYTCSNANRISGFQDGLWSMKILTYHYQYQYLQSLQVKGPFLLLQSVLPCSCRCSVCIFSWTCRSPTDWRRI